MINLVEKTSISPAAPLEYKNFIAPGNYEITTYSPTFQRFKSHWDCCLSNGLLYLQREHTTGKVTMITSSWFFYLKQNVIFLYCPTSSMKTFFLLKRVCIHRPNFVVKNSIHVRFACSL